MSGQHQPPSQEDSDAFKARLETPPEPTTIRGRIEAAIPLMEHGMSGPALVHLDRALVQWDFLMLQLAEAERGISFNGDSKSILQQILKADSNAS